MKWTREIFTALGTFQPPHQRHTTVCCLSAYGRQVGQTTDAKLPPILRRFCAKWSRVGAASIQSPRSSRMARGSVLGNAFFGPVLDDWFLAVDGMSGVKKLSRPKTKQQAITVSLSWSVFSLFAARPASLPANPCDETSTHFTDLF
jgi:hypothetical protein